MKKNILLVTVIFIISLTLLNLINSTMLSESENFWINNVAFSLTIVYSFLTFFIIRTYSKSIAFFGTLLIVFIYTIFAWSIKLNSPEFSRLAIILTQTVIIAFAMTCGTIVKNKTENKIKSEVAKYVTEQVLDNLDDQNSITAKGTKENLTVMFIDIRDFTTISEKHTAEEVTGILNSYFQEIIPAVKKHKGIINKFMGDALLIIFKGQTPEEHAKNAVLAGKNILRRIKNFRHLQEYEGKEKISAGIGINTGEVFIGCLGTEDRCEYTVIGDTVNIASRTESANKMYKTDFLITENTYAYVKDIADVIKISDVHLRGKRDKVNVYEVLRVSENE